MTTAQPVAGYFRVSKARDEMRAPDIYREQILDYVKYKKLTLGETYSDIDYSGRKGARERPGLAELVANRAQFSAVVTPRLNRFGRSLRDLAELFEIFDSDGIGLVFLDIDVDTRTSTGRLVRNIMASLAEWESDRLSESWKAAHRHNARNGRPHGGQAPYGYRFNSEAKSYATVARQARVVKEIFDRYLIGEGAGAIAKDLDRRGIRTSRDARWSRHTVLGMLANPAYAGLVRSDGELVEATWEAIIPGRTFKAAVELRKTTKLPAGAPPRAGKGLYPLSGLIVCGVCGRNLHHVPEKKTNPAMYACPDRPGSGDGDCPGGGISAERAEAATATAFLERITSPYVRAALKAPKELFPQTRSESPSQQNANQLEEIDRKIGRLALQLAEARPRQERAVRAEIEKLEDEATGIEADIARTKATDITVRRQISDLKELRKRLSRLDLIWEAATMEERREMLGLAIESVVLVPRPQGNPRGKGVTRGRRVEIEWAQWVPSA